jgi:ubiquinone/menaquinone biosynthesis C-methylase UbiE
MGAIDGAARRLVGVLAERQIPAELVGNWVDTPAELGQEWSWRLNRFRKEVVPWLDAVSPLAGQRILEVGIGTGPSTVALVEQGASVVGIDIDDDDVDAARTALAASGLGAELRVMNATGLGAVASGVDQIIFWAVLEHMTVDERLSAIRSAWAALVPGGLLTVVETPNRLWPLDSHTSLLPYFSWLPTELAYRYSHFSPRSGFGDRYLDPEPTTGQILHFQRRGHGVSFHEFTLALDMNPSELPVASCMQLHRRRKAPYRGVAWTVSAAGRTERVVRSYSSDVHRAWFQPFLYLSLRK